MSAYTPGPWFVRSQRRHEVVCEGIPGTLIKIARLSREEDAALIAAAPDMLEVLKFAERACASEDYEPREALMHILKRARKAIARAEGA